MNELVNGLEYDRTNIADLLIISNSNFGGHINKVKIVLKKLIAAGFKINAKNLFLETTWSILVS